MHLTSLWLEAGPSSLITPQNDKKVLHVILNKVKNLCFMLPCKWGQQYPGGSPPASFGEGGAHRYIEHWVVA